MTMTYLTDKDTEEKIIDRFREHLKLRNMRNTPERFAILRRAMRIKGHFAGADLYAMLESEGYHVSRMTVYSTLELLCQCGLVNRHMLDTRSARYEMAFGHHCHLICMNCGKVTEVPSPDFTSALESIRPSGFSPAYFSTSVYGLCNDCASAGNFPDLSPTDHENNIH